MWDFLNFTWNFHLVASEMSNLSFESWIVTKLKDRPLKILNCTSPFQVNFHPSVRQKLTVTRCRSRLTNKLYFPSKVESNNNNNKRGNKNLERRSQQPNPNLQRKEVVGFLSASSNFRVTAFLNNFSRFSLVDKSQKREREKREIEIKSQRSKTGEGKIKGGFCFIGERCPNESRGC